jgi:GNAT superfamily N-acetyltransferase
MLSKLEKRLKESWIKLDEDLTAFHGTGNSVPHKRFDINKIGSKGGEGGQSKGWGLYFAGEKAVAQYYRQILNGTIYPVRPNSFNLNGTSYAKENGKFLKGNGKEISKDEYAKAFRAAQAEEETNSKNGKLYQVDIPEQEEYLNLDHPMTSEFQSNSVLSAFEKARQQFPDKIRGSRGDSFYQSLANIIGSQKGASLWLKDHGVPGSCFKDKVSRERGGSTYNYVIFDDSKINIKGIEESDEEFLSYDDKQKPIDDELNKQLKVIMDKWESEGIECYFYTKHGDLTLSRIIIPKEKRGQGLGSEKIKELQRFAAKHNLRILLTPDKSLGATSKGRLEKFYRGLGFYKNAGRNKDFRTSETFIWRPNDK